MYLSLSEVQIQREEDINRNPISKGHEEIIMTPAEVLYQVFFALIKPHRLHVIKLVSILYRQCFQIYRNT